MLSEMSWLNIFAEPEAGDLPPDLCQLNRPLVLWYASAGDDLRPLVFTTPVYQARLEERIGKLLQSPMRSERRVQASRSRSGVRTATPQVQQAKARRRPVCSVFSADRKVVLRLDGPGDCQLSRGSVMVPVRPAPSQVWENVLEALT